MAAHHQHRLRLPPPPRPLRPVSVPAPHLSGRRHRARPPSVSFRPPPPPPPPSPRPPLPKKHADYEAATDTGEEGGAVVDDEAEGDEQRDYGEYVASVGAGLPAHLRAARAGPGGDPLFFLLTAVAVTTSVAFTGMVAVAIPTMLLWRSYQVQWPLHEIADGVNKSAKVAQAVEAGIGQMRDIARQQAISIIEERANLRTIPTTGPDKRSHESSSRQLRQKGPDV
ncbi:uncharacterized protein LOC133906465 isoform X2 [Phragmites australis]|uniref:uncharacterized protein LOC133906465 isoform X2 n=1 Tax=Phragmites australis TaxID=29695 RepID=UPI002D76F2D7|nr:uncharacterized protein LOC133906465 isoform X2 [Phragmites australis]